MNICLWYFWVQISRKKWNFGFYPINPLHRGQNYFHAKYTFKINLFGSRHMIHHFVGIDETKKLFIKHFFLNPIFSTPGERKVWFGTFFRVGPTHARLPQKVGHRHHFFFFHCDPWGVGNMCASFQENDNTTSLFYVNFSVWKTLTSGYFEINPHTLIWWLINQVETFLWSYYLMELQAIS